MSLCRGEGRRPVLDEETVRAGQALRVQAGVVHRGRLLRLDLPDEVNRVPELGKEPELGDEQQVNGRVRVGVGVPGMEDPVLEQEAGVAHPGDVRVDRRVPLAMAVDLDPQGGSMSGPAR